MKDLIQKLLLVASFGISLSTNASLIGDTVDCATTGVGIACSSPTEIVRDELVEFTIDDSNFGPRIDLDIGESSISIQLSGSNSFNNTGFGNRAFTLRSNDWFIDDVTLSGVNNIMNFVQTDISFDEYSLTLDLTGTAWRQNAEAILNITADQQALAVPTALAIATALAVPTALAIPTALAVPEPTTIALLGLSLIGLVGLKFAREKKKSGKTRKNKN